MVYVWVACAWLPYTLDRRRQMKFGREEASLQGGGVNVNLNLPRAGQHGSMVA